MGPPPLNVPDDLDEPLDAIRDTFNKYYPLLTGKSMPDATPTIVFDWTECLREPLATDEYYEAIKAGSRREAESQSRAVLESIKNRGRKRD